MGTSYTAVAGIGILIDPKLLRGEAIPVYSCEHAERLGRKFCPTCGKEVKTYHQPGHGDGELTEELFEMDRNTHPGLTLTHIDFHGNVWFLGVGAEAVYDEHEMLALPDLNDLDERISKFLDNLKTVDDPSKIVVPDSFGLHVAMPGS